VEAGSQKRWGDGDDIPVNLGSRKIGWIAVERGDGVLGHAPAEAKRLLVGAAHGRRQDDEENKPRARAKDEEVSVIYACTSTSTS
jgi:hypothetical protein